MVPAPTCPPGQSQPSWQGSCMRRVPGCRCEQRRGHEVAQGLSTWPGGRSAGSAESELVSQGGGCLGTGCRPWRSAGTGPGLGSTAGKSRHPAPWVLTGAGLQVTFLPLLRVLGLARCPPRTFLAAATSLGGAPPQGAEQLLQADRGPRAGHSWGRHTRDPLTQVLWAAVCRKGSDP